MAIWQFLSFRPTSIAMAMIPTVRLLSTFLLSSFLAVSLHVIFFSPISPRPLHFPSSSSSSASHLPPNNKLQGVSKLGEGFLRDPEDTCVDKDGTLYAASRDGWIKRFRHGNGYWENWKYLDSRTMLGLTAAKAGQIIVCDAEKGLLEFSDHGVSTIASHINGSKIRFADDVIEAEDGSLYFSVASTKFDLHNWYLDVLEAKPHGQLLKYDPISQETTVVLDHLCFANGVALSKHQDFLVVCESWKFRCQKYWLKGEKKGKMEIFVENLPGGPDNINLAPDGSFWIALLQLTAKEFDFIHTSKAAKHLIAAFPKMVEFVSGMRRRATVVKVGGDGKITQKLEDPDGKVMNFVTSALEFEDHLYLGSLNSDFVGKLALKSESILQHH